MPLGRIGVPADVGSAVAFLALRSGDRWITSGDAGDRRRPTAARSRRPKRGARRHERDRDALRRGWRAPVMTSRPRNAPDARRARRLARSARGDAHRRGDRALDRAADPARRRRAGGRRSRAAPATRRPARRRPRRRADAYRGRRVGGGPAQGRSPLRRPRLARELAVPPADAGLPRARRDRRRARRRRRARLADRPAGPLRARQPARRDRPDELRAHQPAGPQGDDRPRRRQPRHGRAAVRARRAPGPAAGDGRHDAASRSAATSR